MKGFGAQGVALLLLTVSPLALSAENAASRNGGSASAAVEISELQKALQESRAEAEVIENRNRKLAERRQSLERRIAELREQMLQQEQTMEPVESAIPVASGPDDENERAVSDDGSVAAPQAQK
jgi:DNA repair exonuclease SbcCD ATPase subunit